MSRSIASRSEIEREISSLYGAEIDWRRACGVVHVAAIGARPRAAIAIGSGAPASRTDRFALGFARARADVIVTSSAILRAEPELVLRASEDPDEDAAWRRWRFEQLGRKAAPLCLVVSQSGRLPPAHPLLRGPGRTIVATTRKGRGQLAAAANPFEIAVVDGLSEEDGASAAAGGDGGGPGRLLSAAIAWLRRARGAETIVLEAGPSSTFGFYREAPGDPGVEHIDELLLSIFAGSGFPDVPGPELPERAILAGYFGMDGASQPQRVERRRESSGAWEFERYRRVAKT